jgi:hypothetical protein
MTFTLSEQTNADKVDAAVSESTLNNSESLVRRRFEAEMVL